MMSIADPVDTHGRSLITKSGALRLAFVIPTMEAGGAERVAATLCNHWADMGHDVHLITFEGDTDVSHYSLALSVRRHKLDLLRNSRSLASFAAHNLKRVFVLRRVLRSIAPDAVISFMPEPNVIALIASIGQRWPVIVSERIHPGFMQLGSIPAGMRRLMYPRAASVVVQASAIGRYVDETFKVTSTTIPNPVDLTQFTTTDHMKYEPVRRRIVSVGRLDRQKGFDLLIDAFGMVANDFPDWDLVVFGEGNQRTTLEQQIDAHNLTDRIRLAGTVTDTAQELQHTDIYAQSSRFEGTPNAVIEALACGCPVIATDCPGGIRDILGDSDYGQLVPVDDAAALAEALRRLMTNETLRQAMSQRAPVAVADLSVSVIAAQWISLAQRLIAERRRL